MRIFITGISSGIGREIARELVLRGHQVWGVARRDHLLRELATELNSPDFSHDGCDVTSSEQVEKVIKKMERKDFLPDIVILNAAIELPEENFTVSSQKAAAIIQTNYLGAYVWIDHFLERFLARKKGQFLAVSSLFAFRPDPDCISYAASKAALTMAFRGLRIRYARTPLKFKILFLGPVTTGINPRFQEPGKRNFFTVSPEKVSNFINQVIAAKSSVHFYPQYLRYFTILTGWMPDSLFHVLSNRFRR
ncbi:MAG: SDR family NAD(P)-dependent oxidoreductase [Candidatus Cloacimonetes bacterium]|nr:SDR family NAD(P)-dependent oxidoreductase [Candidatus Cloacimonadota bacterium]